jgi:predicted amidohydrolase
MKIALGQMTMSAEMNDNVGKTLDLMERAAEQGAQLILFPELQLSPFFPQYPGKDAGEYALTAHHEIIQHIRDQARKLGLVCIPNLYLREGDHLYDASPVIDSNGEMPGISKMVHIVQIPCFYEQDYYAPSDDGFKVYETTAGKIGVVICFDRHFPESIRTCVLKGAELIVIPTAIVRNEPLEMFEWEMRVAAMQNGVFIAMCNRVGREDVLDFCGRSLVIGPDGDVLAMADDREQILYADLDFSRIQESRRLRPYLSLRRPEHYG